MEVVVLDKRHVGLKSPNMEAAAMKQGLNNLKDNGVTVAELVTDAHRQIGSIMSKYSTVCLR